MGYSYAESQTTEEHDNAERIKRLEDEVKVLREQLGHARNELVSLQARFAPQDEAGYYRVDLYNAYDLSNKVGSVLVWAANPNEAVSYGKSTFLNTTPCPYTALAATAVRSYA